MSRNSRYAYIDSDDLRAFIDKLGKAGREDFKKVFLVFLEGIGEEFLRIVEDEIIRKKTVDTRLLLMSFQRGEKDNIFTLNEGNFSVEVGTNVEYASYANDGHWTCKKGEKSRFVPGIWQGDRFIYQQGAKTGMLLKQKYIEGSHYWESAIRGLDSMLPKIMEAEVQQWIDSYFGKFM